MKKTWRNFKILLEQTYIERYPAVVAGLLLQEDESLVDGGPVLRAYLIIKDFPNHLKGKDPVLRKYLAEKIAPITQELHQERYQLMDEYPELETSALVSIMALEDYQELLAEKETYS